MLDTFTWWVMLEVIGIAATPIIFFLARRLPGRGYALAKIAGILLVSYIVWLAGILHLMAFSRVSVLIALLLVTALSGWLLAREGGGLGAELRAFVREQRALIIVTEVLFTVAFLGWAFYRAHDPQVTNTEKYMDFGIVNAILQSEYFPPHDQWMSGFNINYYYFGYLITAALTKMSGVSTNVSFNLANALYFALGVVGSFGILWELVALRRRSAGQLATQGRQAVAPYVVGILGALLIMCGGNLYGAKTLFTAPDMSAAWTHIWNDGLYGNVGWDSSRIVKDTYNGVPAGVDTINEFPAFSYMLADLHPHVMALPLTMLALFLALVLLVSGYGAKSILSSDTHARLMLLMLGIAIGGLYMANTWDFPTYLLFALATLLINRRRLAVGVMRLVGTTTPTPPVAPPATSDYKVRTRKAQPTPAPPSDEVEESAPAAYWDRLMARPWLGWVIQAAAVTLLSLLLYVPYLLTYKAPFGSSLPREVMNDPTIGGIVQLPVISFILRFVAPNVWDKSWGGFAIIFGLSLYATVIFLIAQAWKAYRANEVKIGGYIVAGLFVVCVLLAVLLKFPLLALLAPMVGLAVYALARLPRLDDADSMVTLMIGLGALVALGTELFFLRDVFDNRQNTLFKFYFQLWLIWNLASIYAAWWIVSRAWGWLRERVDEVRVPALSAAAFVWAAGFVLLLAGSALYLPAAMREKGIFYGSVAQGAASPANNLLTLDGWYHFGQSNPSDLAAMNWMRKNISSDAIIAEGAPEVEYQINADGGRVSSYTGIASVLSWRGHEFQWHNGDEAVLQQVTDRMNDVQRLFIGSAQDTQAAVDKYQIDFIFVGKVERDAMQSTPNATDKFTQLGYVPVYSEGNTTIYRTPYALGPLGPKPTDVVAGANGVR